MRRLTDTDIWDNAWYHNRLGLAEKHAWRYLCDKCDNAGVWQPNFAVATVHIFGENSIDPKMAETHRLDWEEFLEKCEGRIEILKNGKWWINEFIPFQCKTHLRGDPKNKPHASIIQLLRGHGLLLRFEQVEIRVWGKSEFMTGIDRETVDEALPAHAKATKATAHEHDETSLGLKLDATPTPRMRHAKEILDYINLLSKHRFTDVHMKSIISIIGDGEYPMPEVIKTLDRQWALWKDNAEMREHFTPSTLFRRSNWITYYDKRDYPLPEKRQASGPVKETSAEQHKEGF